jgi:hypothetical protein
MRNANASARHRRHPPRVSRVATHVLAFTTVMRKWLCRMILSTPDDATRQSKTVTAHIYWTKLTPCVGMAVAYMGMPMGIITVGGACIGPAGALEKSGGAPAAVGDARASITRNNKSVLLAVEMRERARTHTERPRAAHVRRREQRRRSVRALPHPFTAHSLLHSGQDVLPSAQISYGSASHLCPGSC